MANYEERLRRQFEEWVILGSGLLPQWGEPVCPEPPFTPFPGYRMRGDTPVDDGQRPTGVSSLVESLRFHDGPAACEEPATTDENGEAPDYLLDEFSDCVEFSLTSPMEVAWPPRDFEPFLYSSAARSSVCFEYRANARGMDLQIIVPESSRSELATTLATDLPGVIAEPRPMQLEGWVLDPEPDGLWMRELALQREFFFPVLTPREIDRDPHLSLLSALAYLEETERVIVQIRFEPCVNCWAESIWRLISVEDGKSSPFGGGDFIAAAKAKLRKPLFAATIRLAVIDATEERTEQIARRLVASFASYEGLNAFILADEFKQDPGEMLYDLIHRKSRRSGMLLNSDELLGLVHLPAPPAGEPKLKRTSHHTRSVPYEHRGSKSLLLGINQHQGEENQVGLTISERSRHMHVIGASGSGKSTFLLQSILQDLANGHGLALLDPHGDLVEAVLNRLPENRVKDVVLFDPADVDHPLGFNILRAHSEIERTLLASDFVAIFERLSSSWGDQMTAVLGNAALAFLESDRGGTLLDLRRFLVEKGFRQGYLRSVRDPEVVYFWTHEFPLLKGNTIASLVTRINSFLRQKLVRNMVVQDGKRFDVGRLMNEGKVILAPFAQGLIGEENSWLLGSLLVSKFYQAALSRQEIAEEERRPFWLYLDEAHRFLTPSIASILSGARKYGLGLVLAHQELDQFGSQERSVLSSILTNCLTRVGFQLGDQDAKKLADGFAHFSADELRQLEIGNAVCRIGGSDRDFNLTIERSPEPPPNAAEIRKLAVEHSRETYATPREEIEASLYGDFPTPDEPKAPPRSRRKAQPAPETVKVPEASQKPPRETADESPAPEPAEPEPAEPDQPPPATPTAPPKAAGTGLPGRGGKRHKFLQQLIKQHANGLGLRATIEAGLADGAGLVDVLVEGEGQRIAFEVALHSPIEQEIKNITKSLEAGCSQVVIVSDEAAHLNEIQKTAESAIPSQEQKKIRYLEADQLSDLFAEMGAEQSSHRTQSRGFKVTTRYVAGAEKNRDLRSKAVHRTVAENRIEER